MKIAFVGSHGVGKTTLCFDLAAQLKRRGVNVDMVKEVARASPLTFFTPCLARGAFGLVSLHHRKRIP